MSECEYFHDDVCDCRMKLEAALQKAQEELKTQDGLIADYILERDRYREALERIRDSHGDDECGFCGSLMTAKSALSSTQAEEGK